MKKLFGLTLLSYMLFGGIAHATIIDRIIQKAAGGTTKELVQTELAFSGTTIWILVAVLIICIGLLNLATDVASQFGGSTSNTVGNAAYSSVAMLTGATMATGGKIGKGIVKLGRSDKDKDDYKESKRAYGSSLPAYHDPVPPVSPPITPASANGDAEKAASRAEAAADRAENKAGDISAKGDFGNAGRTISVSDNKLNPKTPELPSHGSAINKKETPADATGTTVTAKTHTSVANFDGTDKNRRDPGAPDNGGIVRTSTSNPQRPKNDTSKLSFTDKVTDGINLTINAFDNKKGS